MKPPVQLTYAIKDVFLKMVSYANLYKALTNTLLEL
jgi:hypothetical protein